MPSIAKTHYPSGWCPSDDPINGRRDGLARMDNLTLEQKGVVSLIRGTEIASPGMGSGITSIYSRRLSGGLFRYIHEGTSTYRDLNEAKTFATTVLTGGGGYGCAFATVWGHVLLASGAAKRRDNGGTPADLVLATPAAPTVAANTSPALCIDNRTVACTGNYNNWVGIETNQAADALLAGAGVDYLEFDLDSASLRGIAQTPANGGALTIDSLAYSGGGIGTDEDILKFNFRASDTNEISRVRIEILLKTPQAASTTPDVTDYYIHEWAIKDGVTFDETSANPSGLTGQPGTRRGLNLAANFRHGINVWNVLSCRRGDFDRVGTDDTVGWSTIKGIRIVVFGSSAASVVVNDIRFEGGTTGPLRGSYKYVAIAVYENDNFIGKSPIGAESAEVVAINSSIAVTPAAVPSNGNKVWIYRIGGKLDGYYLVKNDWTSGSFNDTQSDDDLLRQGNKLAFGTFAGVPDNVISIVGPIRDRVLYLTQRSVHFSDTNDPCRYNTNHVAEIAGDEGEVIVFGEQVGEDQVLIATTKDFYILSGQFLEDPETGFLDFSMKAYGTKFPALTVTHAMDKNILFYRSADGIRAMSGSQTELLTEGNLQLLFNKYSRQGLSPITLPHQGIGTPCVNGMAIANNKLYSVVNFQTEGIKIIVMDFATKSWELIDYEASIAGMYFDCFFTEEDGRLLAGGPTASNKILHVLDTGTYLEGDITKSQGVKFHQFYDDADLPRNRKDAFTLKVIADTGNVTVTIYVDAYTDSGTVTTYSTTKAFDGRVEEQFDIYGTLGAAKKFRVRIEGTVKVFKLYHTAIEFEPRPEQLSSLRIKAINFGTAKRKKFIAIPLVVDGLGAEFRITPIIDGAAQAPSLHTTNAKLTVFHWFTTDVQGIDCELLIQATGANTVFEFYEFAASDALFEVLPVAGKYIRIPEQNWGTAARKRFNRLSFVLNPRGVAVNVTPVLDGVLGATQSLGAGSRKQTINYYHTADVTPVDIGAIIESSQEFEFYEMLKPEILEVLPEPVTFLRVPNENFGTFARKRFNRLTLVIDSRSSTITVVPVLDGVDQSPQTFTTDRKAPISYYFADDVVATDIGFKITGTTNFEFYKVLKPEMMEVLPEPVTFFRPPHTNFGHPSKKRIRTIPLVIDTRGLPVIYTPYVDGNPIAPETFTTSRKQTVFYYVTTDVFGVDIGGTLDSQLGVPFEFYGFEKPEEVEVLPVAKRFDQLGPIEFNRAGRIRMIRLRLIAGAASMSYRLLAQDTEIDAGTFVTAPDKDKVYELSLIKGITAGICRLEISALAPFHRLYAEFKVDVGNQGTEWKMVKVK